MTSGSTSGISPIRVKLDFIVGFFLFGSFLSLYELSNRMRILGLTLDGIRNFLLLGIAMVWLLLLVHQRGGRIANVWRIWPFLLFFGWAWLSVAWSTEMGYTIREGLKLVYPLVIYLLVTTYLNAATNKGPRLFLIIRTCLTFYCVLTLLISLFVVLTGMQRGTWEWGASRLLDLPLVVSAWTASTYILLEMAIWQKLPNVKPRWWLVGGMMGYVLLTLTRADIFGLFVAVAFLIFIVLKRWWARLIIIALAISAIILILTVDNPIKRRMFWYPEQVTFISVVQTGLNNPGRFLASDYIRMSGRLVYWHYMLNEAQDRRPELIGAGFGASRAIMQASPFTEGVGHGDFVSNLADLGYVGLSVLLVMYTTALTWSILMSRNRRVSPTGQAAALALTGHLILGTLVGLVYNPLSQGYTYVLIGVVLAAIVQSESTISGRRLARAGESGGLVSSLDAPGYISRMADR